MRSKLFYSIMSFCVILLFAVTALAKDVTLNKTYEWSYNVDARVTVSLKNYDCDVNIQTTSSDKVVLKVTIDAEADRQEDLDVLDGYLEGLSFSAGPDRVTLETIFWEKRDSNGGMDRSTKMDLKNGETVRLNDFKISATLHIPATAQLDLESKYSEIHLGDVRKLDLDSYDDKIYGGNVAEPMRITAKYSDLEFDEFGPAEIDFYDCNMKAAKAGGLELKTKYSDLKINDAGAIDLEGYDDDLTFRTTGDMRVNTKYSDIKSISSGNLTLNIYDSNFDIESIGQLSISESKYSEYKFQKAGEIRISISYDDKFLIDDLVSIKTGNTKYSDYLHENVKSFFEITEGYDENIAINHTSPSFTRFDINSKYGNVTLKTAEDLPLRIDWKTKYGKIDMDESAFTTRVKIRENSEYEYQGERGSKSANMPVVKVRGYDVKMSVME